jgi:GNAT superfamily N-acetyltransferase
VTLRDGTLVTLRPIRADDKELVLGAFERLSEESRYRRFFTSVPVLDGRALAYLTEVDHYDHEAIVALDRASGEILGVARYVRSETEPDEAEVAVAVVDDAQGRGVGRALLHQLTNRARGAGIRRFTALVQAENRGALTLLGGIGETETLSERSEIELSISLPRTRGIGAQAARALRAAASGSVSARLRARELWTRE